MSNKNEQLAKLKKRADMIGMDYPNNITVEKLSAKLKEALTEDVPEAQAPQQAEGFTTSKSGKTIPLLIRKTVNQIKGDKRKESSKLRRVHITCMDPNKTAYQGELITGSNDTLSVTKYVLFNEPYHIPQILYDILKEKKCTTFIPSKGSRGMKTKELKEIQAYNVTDLPPLTQSELKDLATQQAMAGTVGR